MTKLIDFSPELKNKIDHWISKYPPEQKKSALIPVLLLVQEDYQGWLTDALMETVADYLSISYIEVYEAAAFYSMLELKPAGKYKISVCTNISCMLSGSQKIVDYFKQKLNIHPGETSADKKFSLKEVECLGACVNAPVIHLGHRYYENLTPEKLDKILDELS